MISGDESGQILFTRLKAVSRDVIYLGTVPEGQELGSSFTAIVQYNAGRWSYDEFPYALADMTLSLGETKLKRTLKILFETGLVVDLHTKNVEIVLAPDDPVRHGHRLGYLRRIANIGDRLYVAGAGGQVFKREESDKWQLLDKDLLDGSNPLLDKSSELSCYMSSFNQKTQITDADVEEYKRRMSSVEPKVFWAIAGASADGIYVAGEGGLAFWYDGVRFVEIPARAEAAILAILPEASGRVWMCGREGMLLFGDHKTGFQRHPGISGAPYFSSMARFNQKLYLGSYANPRGLFVLDGTELKRVWSGLVPDIIDVNMIEAVDDVLWVMGTRDLLRYDGARWERFHLPA